MRALLALAWPIVVSRASQAVVGFSDAAMVAPLGEDALAATTTGSMNTFTVLILPMGMAFVVSTFSSQLTGEGRHGAARRFGWYGLMLAAVTAVVSVLSVPLVPAGVALLGFTPGVSTPLVTYLQVRLLSGGAAVGMEALGNYYGGIGNTRLPMLGGILTMVVNVFLNWVLIYGNLGAPALGVAGAAWASNIATLVGLVFLLACFVTGAGAPGSRMDGTFSWQDVRTLLRVGLPSGLNWFMEFAAFVVFINVIMGSLGTTVLAGMMAVLELCRVGFMPAFALASAGAIMAGQALGARDHAAVPGHMARTAALAVGWQGALGVVFLAAPTALISLFAAPGQEASRLVEVGVDMLLIAAIWQVFDAVAAVIAETLRAAGDTSFTLWARVAVSWGVAVPGGWITVKVLGAGHQAAMAWFVIYLGLLAGILWVRFRGGRWKTLDVTAGVAGH